MRVGLSAWSMQLHPNWDATENPDGLQLSAAEEGGELDLSSGLKECGKVTLLEMRERIAELPGQWPEPESVSYGAFKGFRLGGNDDGLFMTWWFLASGPLLLRARYNGLPRCSEAELQQIEAMLATIRCETQII